MDNWEKYTTGSDGQPLPKEFVDAARFIIAHVENNEPSYIPAHMKPHLQDHYKYLRNARDLYELKLQIQQLNAPDHIALVNKRLEALEGRYPFMVQEMKAGVATMSLMDGIVAGDDEGTQIIEKLWAFVETSEARKASMTRKERDSHNETYSIVRNAKQQNDRFRELLKKGVTTAEERDEAGTLAQALGTFISGMKGSAKEQQANKAISSFPHVPPAKPRLLKPSVLGNNENHWANLKRKR